MIIYKTSRPFTPQDWIKFSQRHYFEKTHIPNNDLRYINKTKAPIQVRKQISKSHLRREVSSLTEKNKAPNWSKSQISHSTNKNQTSTTPPPLQNPQINNNQTPIPQLLHYFLVTKTDHIHPCGNNKITLYLAKTFHLSETDPLSLKLQDLILVMDSYFLSKS